MLYFPSPQVVGFALHPASRPRFGSVTVIPDINTDVRTQVQASLAAQTACNAGDPSLILGPRRSPAEGNGNPLQYSCLENPVDRRTWWAAVHGVTKSQTRLSDIHIHICKDRKTLKRINATAVTVVPSGDGIESKEQENSRVLLLCSSGLFEFVMMNVNDFVILEKWGGKKANSSATSSRKPQGLLLRKDPLLNTAGKCCSFCHFSTCHLRRINHSDEIGGKWARRSLQKNDTAIEDMTKTGQNLLDPRRQLIRLPVDFQPHHLFIVIH